MRDFGYGQGGGRQANAEIIRRILRNEDQGPRRDALLFNAGAALFVTGKTKSVSAGWELASEVLKNGEADEKPLELASGFTS